MRHLRRQRKRWVGCVAVAFVVAACSGNSSGTPDDPPASADAPETLAIALGAAAAQVEPGSVAIAGVFADGIAEVRAEQRSGDGQPPASQDLVDALQRLDWVEILDGDGAAPIASRVEQATLDAYRTDYGSASSLVAAVGSLLLDPVRQEQTISDGTKSGNAAMEADRTFDADSGRETTTWAVDADVTDSETGERVVAHTEGEAYHDVCWGEDGGRESGVTASTGVTTEGPGGSETSEQSRTTTVRRDADGSVTISVSVTVGVFTMGRTSSDSKEPGRQGESTTTDGDRVTHTTQTEYGETTITVDQDATWSDDELQQAIDEFGDAEKAQSSLEAAVEALQRPLSPSSPGADEFCLKLSLDPTSGSLEADGDTLGFDATVRDWNDRPVVSAIVSVEGARLGSIAPELGPTSTDGVWTTTYTSGDAGTETLAFEAAHFGYTVNRTATVTIGSGYVFEWSRSQSGSTASVTARSCDGKAWTGTFSFTGSPGGAEISMTATFAFQTEGTIGETDFVSTGTIGAGGELLPMEMPYHLTITLDGDVADVQIDRSGGGVIVAEGRRVPIPTEGFPEFVFTTPLEVPTDCP